jgi:3-hydroxyacyl-[acyl-carrier-protein] dehydratase
MISIDEIQKILPHRYPFLLVDRVISIDSAKSIHAVKCVTINEPYFEGHFPEKKIMPGVLIVEAMAQCAGILLHKQNPGGMFFLGGIDKARFRSLVTPGMCLDLMVSLEKEKRGLYWFSCQAKCNDDILTSASIMLAINK